MSEQQSKIRQVWMMSNPGSLVIEDCENGVSVTATFGEASHAGEVTLQFVKHNVDDALDSWLAAARAIQAAFEDGPATEPAGDTDADAGASE